MVLASLTVVLLRLIRRDINREPEKSRLWVRRWALMLTLFVAGATIAVDLITLINTFLGGELTTRFLLKVAVVLLVAAGGFMHFYADLKGYWLAHQDYAKRVGYAVAVLAILSVVAGFFIIGSPSAIRLMRIDDQKESDLLNLQYQIVNYYQIKRSLPQQLADVEDPLSGYMLPADPQTGEAYEYRRLGSLSFELCAVFNREDATNPNIPRPVMSGVENESWKHGIGRTCFARTIDPERYPPFSKPVL